MAQHFIYPPSDATISGTVVVDQGTSPWIVSDPAAEASLASIDTKLTNPLPVSGPLTDAQLRAVAVPVSAAALPLPSGAATAANQATEIASLASIDAKLTNPLPVSGPLTDAELRATPVPVSISGGLANPLPVHDAALDVNLSTRASEATLAAFSAKSAGAFVTEAFDYADITYVGITNDIDQVVYKSGGSGGTTVATVTLGYDGSNRLNSVTKT